MLIEFHLTANENTVTFETKVRSNIDDIIIVDMAAKGIISPVISLDTRLNSLKHRKSILVKTHIFKFRFVEPECKSSKLNKLTIV